MERRKAIQLLAAGATSLWAKQRLPAASQDLRVPEPLLPLFPLDLVLFPETNLPLHIFEERYKEMIKVCLLNHWEFGILLQIQDNEVKSVGCTASISEVTDRFPNGELNIMVRGRRRFEIADVNEEKAYLRGKPEFLDDDENEPADEDLRKRGIELYGHLKELIVIKDPEPAISDTQLSYRMMGRLPADLEWKQELLELRSERERLDLVVSYFEKLIEFLEKQSPGPSRDIALLSPDLR
jgi:Lon protease-like protein